MPKLADKEIVKEVAQSYLADILDALTPRYATGKRAVDVADIKVGDTICPDGRKKEFVVREKTECPSQWRTHVHINKTLCYDERAKVVVK